jgi:small basic protein (TIGR04137 family)
MSLDRSLKSANSLVRHRNVLSRDERLLKLKEAEKWDESKSVFGLPKVAHRKMTIGGKDDKEEAADATAAGAAGATPAAGAAAAGAAAAGAKGAAAAGKGAAAPAAKGAAPAAAAKGAAPKAAAPAKGKK